MEKPNTRKYYNALSVAAETINLDVSGTTINDSAFFVIYAIRVTDSRGVDCKLKVRWNKNSCVECYWSGQTFHQHFSLPLSVKDMSDLVVSLQIRLMLGRPFDERTMLEEWDILHVDDGEVESSNNSTSEDVTVTVNEPVEHTTIDELEEFSYELERLVHGNYSHLSSRLHIVEKKQVELDVSDRLAAISSVTQLLSTAVERLERERIRAANDLIKVGETIADLADAHNHNIRRLHNVIVILSGAILVIAIMWGVAVSGLDQAKEIIMFSIVFLFCLVGLVCCFI
jgi:hypothetical protein